MKILVTGANGQLGNEIRMLATDYSDFQLIFTDVNELDITNEQEVELFVNQNKPTHIINCAAYTAVDKAEQDEETAMLINATAVGNLAKAASLHGAILIHISTDYVFDGNGHRPYCEDDPTSPVSKYARSKLAGELQVSTHSRKALIFRTSWLYSAFGNNFVKTMIKYGKERGKLNVVFDQIGTPTYARDLASSILKIIQQKEEVNGVEIYHYSNEGVASWYDFALAIFEMTGIKCIVSPIETWQYPLPASRPFYSVFNKAKLKNRFNLEIPYWRDSLKDCLHTLAPLL